ncbi:acetoin utilization protein AcuC [Antarctobacter heliothermus]|uniref:Acetoin utilization protein AcuC n=1 Tax=Antarctobacter heliothermus TaxID=74033 RepID=A0A239JNF4_9RHOB|nr:acetoin utilization protein AcuC [Antarctobacter heliothermus]SNT06873.1 acetoin utilization protein AcuC [Antarctobacter heliothermus]
MLGQCFIGSPIYRGSVYGARHPLSIQRVPAVMDLARALGWLPNGRYRTSPRAKPAALTRFHTADYVAALQAAEAAQSVDEAVRVRHGLGTLSNPIFAEMFCRPATAVGGGLLAAGLVAEGGFVHNPGGGQHHGLPDRAAGFCYLNEPILTIERLLEMGLSRVAYVDIDAHHCDGVEAGFAGREDVRMISVHEARRWPFTGALEDTAGGAAFNLPVARGFNDTEFALVLEELILPAVANFRPDAIYLQCGADALAEDPLARLDLSNRCHVAAVRALRALAPRLIVSGGGGYNPWSVARCWTAVWGEIAGFEVPERVPQAAEAVLRRLVWHRKGTPDPALLTTLLDAPREGMVSADLKADVATLKARLHSVV